MSEEFSVSFKTGGCTNCTNCGLCGKVIKENMEVVTDSAVSGKEAALSVLSVKTLAAVDLGTTTLAMYLIDGETGEQIGVYTGLNPQMLHGADVISRISRAMGGERDELRRVITEAIENGIEKLSSGKPEPELIVISGNTVMGHLLMGYDVSKLGTYPFVPVKLGQEETHIKGIRTILMPGISAFVGGDIVSGLYALSFLEKEKPSLLIDLGTNAEMVIGDKNGLVATSAAAGPAFEQKFYATKLIAAVAEILREGYADRTGCLTEEFFETGVRINNSLITQKEIRELQQAKAGVAAGIDVLLKEYGVAAEEVEQVYIAGGLGFYLDMDAAMEVGLFPKCFTGKLQVAGNTSLAGAHKYARAISHGYQRQAEGNGAASSFREETGTPGGGKTGKPEEEIKEIISRVRQVNLAEAEGFQDIFIRNINF